MPKFVIRWIAAVALLLCAAQAHAQTTLTATFGRGAIAEYENNPNQTSNAVLFATLGIDSITISQVSDNGSWGGSQGNDTSVTTRIDFSNGTSTTFPAAINWVRNAGGGVFHWVGLSIGETTMVPDGYAVAEGMQKTYILQFAQSGLSLAGLLPNDLDGSANAGQALAALNQYVPGSSAPVITGPSGGAGAASSAISVNENQTAVTTLTADKTVTWSLTGGADQAKFSISSGGVITFQTAPDYENPTDSDGNNTYVLVAEAKTADEQTATQTVTVTVLNLPDTPPVITGPSGGPGAASSALSVNENQTAVTTVTADKSVTWDIVGGSDQGKFSITSGGVITFQAAPDYEVPTDSDTNNTYVLIVEATAADGQKATQTITVTVLNLPDTPPVITGPSGGPGAASSALSVNENQTAVTTVTADKTVTWDIVGGSDQGKFSITSGGVITFQAAPDYEVPTDVDTNNTYVLIVEATAADGQKATQTITVTVLNLPDTPPVITGPSGGPGAASSALSVNENQTEVTTVTADKSVTWDIVGGSDQGKFSITSGGVITFQTAPDYENPTDSDTNNTYVLIVEATAADGQKATQTITVTVLNLADTPPVITGPSGGAGAASSAISVNENQTGVTTLTANKSVTWEIVGGSDQNKFSITSGGVITFQTAPDYENPTDSDGNNTYVLIVEATAADGQKATQTITVTVLNLADTPPVITGPSGGAGAASSAISVNENQTGVTTLTANKSVTWEIVGGSDQNKFSITSGGVITFQTAPDFENPTDSDGNNTYVLIVEATAADGQKATQTITVTVLNLPDTPPIITGPSGGPGAASSALSVNENQTAVTTVTANKSVTWALVGGSDQGKFSITSGGVITFQTAPDFENPTDVDTNNTYVLIVEATAADGQKATQTITVTVLNLADTPPVITGPSGGAGAASSAISVNENQTAVTTLTASKSVTWAIVGGPDQGKFAITSGGVLTFVAAPDFETPTDVDTNNTYVLIVEATAADGQKATQTVTVTVLNLADTPPVITGPSGGAGAASSAISVNENQTAVTTLVANKSVTWAIPGGADRPRFSLAPNGALTFVAAPDYENPNDTDRNNTYVLIAEATAADGQKATQTITVTVLPVDEIAQKLGEIGGELRTGLREHAFDSLQAALAINEGLLSEDDRCASPNRGPVAAQVSGDRTVQQAGVSYAQSLTDCRSQTRVKVDGGAYLTRRDGDVDTRGFGTVRIEHDATDRVTVGAALTSSFADDELGGFASGAISDRTLQLDVFARWRLTDDLRAGAFLGAGRAWYDFDLVEDGLTLSGEMTGERLLYGAMLSGDLTVGGRPVTVDALVSHASEDLGAASLDAAYLGERRSGIAFQVGEVDATRVSVPAHIGLLGGKGESYRLVLSPGVLCEDRAASGSGLTCGYQLGARLSADVGSRDGLVLRVRHEEVDGRIAQLLSVGYAIRFGRSEALALALTMDQRAGAQGGDSALMLRLTTGR